MEESMTIHEQIVMQYETYLKVHWERSKGLGSKSKKGFGRNRKTLQRSQKRDSGRKRRI